MHDWDASEINLGQLIKKVINDNNKDNVDQTKLSCPNSDRTYYLLIRFQNVANISIFLKNNNGFQLSFTKSHKEINGLPEKKVFEVVIISNFFNGIRIFNFRFIDEIKYERTIKIFEKSRPVIQAYNNHGQDKILTPLSIIQQIN